MDFLIQGRLGSILLFGLMLALIIPLTRLSKKRGQTPFWWETILIAVWTMILLLGRIARKSIAGTQSESIYLLVLMLLGVILFLGVYLFIFIKVYRKKDHLEFDQEIGSIGSIGSIGKDEEDKAN